MPVTFKMHFLLISQAHLEIRAELKLLYPENKLKFFVTAFGTTGRGCHLDCHAEGMAIS